MAGSARVDGGGVVSAEEFAAVSAALPTAHLVMSPDPTVVEADPAHGAIGLRDGADGMVHLTMTPSPGEGVQRRFGVLIDVAVRPEGART